MILADTSLWIDHFRTGNAAFVEALEQQRIVCHPHVIGELALGRLRDRATILSLLQNLPEAPVATDAEVLAMIDARGLAGAGIGYVDAHLLAATLLKPGFSLWTRDKRLHAAAERWGVAHDAPPRSEPLN